MSKGIFIKTSDAETKQTLLALGFELISEDGNVSTFLNNSTLTFDDKNNKLKIAYSNMLTF